MSTHVYANGNEVSCKAADGKTSSAFPDPCWSPPPPPTGPIVVPYPNFAKPSSLKKGSSTVLIKRSAVALTDRSYFSTSTGNEPATPAFMKGVLTKKIKGKTYYNQWSMNVKFEGKGVCRNFDIMTHNHGSFTGNTPPFPFLDDRAKGSTAGDPCETERKNIRDSCDTPDEGKNWNETNCPPVFDGYTEDEGRLSQQMRAAKEEGSCVKALKCRLIPYDNGGEQDGTGCCNGQTPHHLLADSMFKPCGVKRTQSSPFSSKYSIGAAPNICMEGKRQHMGSHQEIHHDIAKEFLNYMTDNMDPMGSPKYPTKIPLDKSIELSSRFVAAEYGCEPDCIQQQLKSYYNEECGMDPKTEVYTVDQSGHKYACKGDSDSYVTANQNKLGVSSNSSGSSMSGIFD
ncbi:PAAR-like domain-containing protein [Enterobacillus tribolii]|uniref:HNH/endonuclease VII toxin of polymorphic toxin system n=1 Tax=Enterobacillus tribolii TaxID=1487935 RepID=A0A370QLX3_9GAMM|nr:PAAR-like domain-containing protein [Enterobacillus tribolii]RDK89354.1 HNH/endonuclease VII toxin of polymorphic toxin system [Enterobacillus tribolii]